MKKIVLIFLSSHWDKLILILLICIYIATMGTLSVLRHMAFASYFDLVNMDHTVWNILHGSFFSLRYADEYVSRLSVHADFILILLAPLYFIWDGPRTLIVSETVFLGLAAIPTYLLARRVLHEKILSLSIVFVLLVNPALLWTNLYDFHPVALAIPFLLAAFYCAYTKHWKWYSLFIFLALLTKEEISLDIMMMGLAIWLILKEWKIGIATSIVGMTWFITMVFFVIPYFSPSHSHWAFEMYSPTLGIQKTTFDFSAFRFFSLYKLIDGNAFRYYNDLLKPFSYLPLIGLPWLFLSLPEIVINTLSSNPAMTSIQFHYDSGITPSLVIATIFGCRYLLLFLDRYKIHKKYRVYGTYALSVIMILVVLRVNYHYSPLPTTPSCWCFIYNVTDEDQAFLQALRKIPKDASITASIEIRPHVNHRKDVWFVPSATESAQFIALITQNRLIGNYEPKIYENKLIPILLADKNHKVVFRSEHFYLFEKTN